MRAISRPLVGGPLQRQPPGIPALFPLKHLRRRDPAARHGERKDAARQRFTTFAFHTSGYFLVEPAASSDGKGFGGPDLQGAWNAGPPGFSADWAPPPNDAAAALKVARKDGPTTTAIGICRWPYTCP